MVILRSLKYLVALSAITLVQACGGDSTQPETSSPALALVSGSGQTAVAGATVADPLVVQVTRDGSPLSGASVTWTVTAGGGSPSPASSVTDSNGQASTTWTLGSTDGSNTLEASVAGATGSPIEFTATGTPFTPQATASVSVGDNFFDPTQSTIAVDGTVTWTWTGSIGHNVTFGSGNSPTQTSGTYAMAFPAAGSFPYQCTIHPGQMNGTIVVQ